MTRYGRLLTDARREDIGPLLPQRPPRPRGIALIVPRRSNRRRTQPQYGRVLRRYRKRWTVECDIAGLANFRWLAVRYDRSLTVCQAFLHIARFTIALRKVLERLLMSRRRLQAGLGAAAVPSPFHNPEHAAVIVGPQAHVAF